MSWILVPALVSLRAEFNQLAPGRDKASDGSIGDSEHSQHLSDHNPDETGATPHNDPDNINEVHAIDVDRDLRQAGVTMQNCVDLIVGRHRHGLDDRLQNVIFDRHIWSKAWGWERRDYHGPNPHDHHAHFSCRYTSSQEADTRPWGLLALNNPKDADDMPTASEIAAAVWSYPLGAPDSAKDKTWPGVAFLLNTYNAAVSARGYSADALAGVTKLLAKDFTDEAAIAAAVLAGLDAEKIAAAIPHNIAAQVADLIHDRLAA
jgi:hypothetical protein